MQAWGRSLITCGNALLPGHGVEVDYARAAALYERAAQAGMTAAQVNLARMHLSGLGVAKDVTKAQELQVGGTT